MNHLRNSALPALLCPQPRKDFTLNRPKRNPYIEKSAVKSSASSQDQDGKLFNEVQHILARKSLALPPINPKISKIPRMCANPIARDSVFAELNSTASSISSDNL